MIVSQGKESDELLNVFKGKFIVSNFTFQVGVGVTWRQVNMNMFSFAQQQSTKRVQQTMKGVHLYEVSGSATLRIKAMEVCFVEAQRGMEEARKGMEEARRGMGRRHGGVWRRHGGVWGGGTEGYGEKARRGMEEAQRGMGRRHGGVWRRHKGVYKSSLVLILAPWFAGPACSIVP